MFLNTVRCSRELAIWPINVIVSMNLRVNEDKKKVMVFGTEGAHENRRFSLFRAVHEQFSNCQTSNYHKILGIVWWKLEQAWGCASLGKWLLLGQVKQLCWYVITLLLRNKWHIQQLFWILIEMLCIQEQINQSKTNKFIIPILNFWKFPHYGVCNNLV